jgi:hypothetical protein
VLAKINKEMNPFIKNNGENHLNEIQNNKVAVNKNFHQKMSSLKRVSFN